MVESVTASAVISFAEDLEDRSTAFYERLAERFAEQQATFLGFAKEGEKNKTLVVRTYRETISDALEACFSFGGVDLAQYAGEPMVSLDRDLGDLGYADALKMALGLEQRAVRFYEDMTQRSQALMATIPMAFSRVAKTRDKRLRKLQPLLDSAG